MTSLPQQRSEKRLGLVIDLDTCVGCHACVVNCKEWNTSGHPAPLSDQNAYGANPSGAWLNRVHGFETGDGDEPVPLRRARSASTHSRDDLAALQEFVCYMREFLAKPIEQGRWRFAYPGVRHMELPIGDAGETVKLLKIKPGKAAPRHTHHGMEATLVLRGAFRDGERVYERGELAVADDDVQHRPRAEGDEDCICLAVTDGALRFTDTLGRMARDFFTV